MLKIFTTSLLGLITVQSVSFRQSVKSLDVKLKDSQVKGPSVTCVSCPVTMCGMSVSLPPSFGTCSELNNMLSEIKESLISKPTTECGLKGSEYVCSVLVEPMSHVFENVCNDETPLLLSHTAKESFCAANEYCPNLAQCSATYNIDCEHDSEILPHINQFFDLTDDVFKVEQCPNHDDDDDNKVKEFFEDYWKDMVISAVISSLFSTVIIIIIICKKSQIIVQQQRDLV